MIAKIVAWGTDRDEALAGCAAALAQSSVVDRRRDDQQVLPARPADRPEVRAGSYDNRWLDRLTAAGEHLPAA